MTMTCTQSATRACLWGVGLLLCTAAQWSQADIWVLNPSISLDQRFDDNYFLVPVGASSLSATRGVAELGVSRETQAASLEGLARVDALLTTRTDIGEDNLDSNQLFSFDARFRTARSRYGARLYFKQDTPSRDIEADISSQESFATDTGLNVTQSLAANVARREITVEPSFEYDVNRRLLFKTALTLTQVEHALPDSQDVIYQRYLDTFDTSTGQTPLAYDQVSIDDVGVFKPDGELDDFAEAEAEFGLRFQLSPIVTLSTTLEFSRFVADVEVDESVVNPEDPFSALIPDSDEPDIRRRPRRESISTTSSFKLGYERLLTPTLRFAADGGVYVNTTDISDTLAAGDTTDPKTESDGWLASVQLAYDAGATRYLTRFAVDVLPSSSGSQVETQELTGEVRRVVNPRLNVALLGRAYEPDRLGARVDDRFARRFISLEPRLQWRFTRNWTVSAAYRYRRQKARIDPVSAESNAVMLAVKYTPPSEIRDAAKASGL